MNELDWYNEQDVNKLAQKEASRFIDTRLAEAQEHFGILADFFFQKAMWDFDFFETLCRQYDFVAVKNEEGL